MLVKSGFMVSPSGDVGDVKTELGRGKSASWYRLARRVFSSIQFKLLRVYPRCMYIGS
jgi:hypothetical protein